MHLLYLLLLISAFFEILPARNVLSANSQTVKDVLKQKLATECPPDELKGFEVKQVVFDFKDTPLVDIINQIASLKRLNIILPQGDLQIKTKLTYQVKDKLTIQQAWKELNNILEYAGYSWIAEQNGQLRLIKVEKDLIAREYLPLYVNPPIDDLPRSGEVIQAIFYLSNIKIGEDTNVQQSIIGTILTGDNGMLSPKAFVRAIPKQNGLLIVDRADNIASAMRIIQAMDLSGIPDAIEVVPLYYTDASFVSSLFNKDLFQEEQTNGPIQQARTAQTEASYFPKNTRVAALDRTNSIVIMGTTKGIRVVKDFVIKYIDHPLESGRSILHIYELQYLDAEEFAPILTRLVQGGNGSTGQAETSQKGTGAHREFEGVIIEAERTRIKSIVETRKEETKEGIKPTELPQDSSASAPAASATASAEGVVQGGNRLIIAARRKDWKRIKILIQQLDKPQPQVAIEVLVVDLILEQNKALGNQMRNPNGFGDVISNNVNFQSAQLTEPILTQGENIGEIPTFPSNALMANLLQFIDASNTENIANTQEVGTTVITLRDPNSSSVWSVWQILDRYTNATMLAQPFITTLDNQQASITISQERLLIGGAAAAGGAVTINNVYVPASTSIDILPRISIEKNNINLNVVIQVNEFVDNQSFEGTTPNNTRITRLVQTNSNVGNNEILAIGGLIRYRDNITQRETPLLGKIPVLGWFFKRKQRIREKNNLMVFISPSIIEPRKSGGLGGYSSKKLCLAEQEIAESVNFQSLRDPITRWFFQPDTGFAKRVVTDYAEKRVFKEQGPCESLTIAQNKPIQQEISDDSEINDKKDKLRQLASAEDNPLLKTQNPKDKIVLNT